MNTQTMMILLSTLISRRWIVQAVTNEGVYNTVPQYSVEATFIGRRHLFVDDSDTEMSWIERMEARTKLTYEDAFGELEEN